MWSIVLIIITNIRSEELRKGMIYMKKKKHLTYFRSITEKCSRPNFFQSHPMFPVEQSHRHVPSCCKTISNSFGHVHGITFSCSIVTEESFSSFTGITQWHSVWLAKVSFSMVGWLDPIDTYFKSVIFNISYTEQIFPI